MERLVIIDHATHQVFIEDVPTELLEKYYDGEEEKYIEDNYNFDGDYSWDFITAINIVTEEGDIEEIDPFKSEEKMRENATIIADMREFLEDMKK